MYPTSLTDSVVGDSSGKEFCDGHQLGKTSEQAQCLMMRKTLADACGCVRNDSRHREKRGCGSVRSGTDMRVLRYVNMSTCRENYFSKTKLTLWLSAIRKRITMFHRKLRNVTASELLD